MKSFKKDEGEGKRMSGIKMKKKEKKDTDEMLTKMGECMIENDNHLKSGKGLSKCHAEKRK